MPRYFFNIEDGHTTIDNEGSEHPDLQAARQEALVTSSETLRDGGGPYLWSGKQWRMWVTDQPRWGGQNVFHAAIFGNRRRRAPLNAWRSFPARLIIPPAVAAPAASRCWTATRRALSSVSTLACIASASFARL
jgi:hypothetical protein